MNPTTTAKAFSLLLGAAAILGDDLPFDRGNAHGWIPMPKPFAGKCRKCNRKTKPRRLSSAEKYKKRKMAEASRKRNRK